MSFFHTYIFLADHVFDESCTNARVYELLTKDIIHAAVEGFNGILFFFLFSVTFFQLSAFFVLKYDLIG